jgi:hypothetical protein
MAPGSRSANTAHEGPTGDIRLSHADGSPRIIRHVNDIILEHDLTAFSMSRADDANEHSNGGDDRRCR